MRKKNIWKMFVVLLVISVMVMTMVIPMPVLAKTMVNKTTAGGWIIDDFTNHRMTFGFSAQRINRVTFDAKGKFQLIDHDADPKMVVKADITTAFGDFPNHSVWTGTCSVNGDDGYDIGIVLIEETEVLIEAVEISISNGGGLSYFIFGAVQHGNINVRSYPEL